MVASAGPGQGAPAAVTPLGRASLQVRLDLRQPGGEGSLKGLALGSTGQTGFGTLGLGSWRTLGKLNKLCLTAESVII